MDITDAQLADLKLPESIDQIHKAITRKCPIDDTEFDAWYTARSEALSEICEIGRSVSARIREMGRLSWNKQTPPELLALLDAKGTAPVVWEDGPDGALAGMAVVLAGWVANQAAAKSRHNSSDKARDVFEDFVRPLIIASMNLGVKLAEDSKTE